MLPARKTGDLRSFDVHVDRIVTRASAHLDSLARIVGVDPSTSQRGPFEAIEPKPSFGIATPARSHGLGCAPRTVAVHPGSFSWHEFHAADARESAIFLADLMEAEVRTRSRGGIDEYSTLLGGGLHLAGGLSSDAREPSRWSAYLRVPDVDLLCERAVHEGGSVRLAPAGIVGLDRRAVISDPTGAQLTVIAGGDDRRTAGTGALGWDELRSTDLMESVRFWCAVLGWSAQPALGSAGGECIVFLNGGMPVASATYALSTEETSRWLPVATFRRGAVEHVVRHAIAQGGSLRVAPHAHAVLGITALIVDRQGLEIAVGGEVADACVMPG